MHKLFTVSWTQAGLQANKCDDSTLKYGGVHPRRERIAVSSLYFKYISVIYLHNLITECLVHCSFLKHVS